MPPKVTLVNEFDQSDRLIIPRLQVSAAELRVLFRFKGQDQDVYLCPIDSDGTHFLISRNGWFLLKAGETYVVGGEPSSSSFASESRDNPTINRAETCADLSLDEVDLIEVTEDVEDAIEEYLQKHAEIEFYLLNNGVPAALPWHCRGNVNRDHRKDWKRMVRVYWELQINSNFRPSTT